MKLKVLTSLLLLAFVTVLPLSIQAQTMTTRYLNGKIIFYHDNGNAVASLYSINPNGSNKQLIPGHGGTSFGPAWSPDGTKIAFAGDGDGDHEIYVANSDGSNRTQLTNNSSSDTMPNWSPDGTKIAFTSVRDGDQEIYTMNADGTNQTGLTNNSIEDNYPAWSHNGSKILFGRVDGGSEVFVMNSDGSNQVNLTNSSGDDSYASWSPDDSRIAYSSNRTGVDQIYIMNADGTNQTNISNTTDADYYTSWSPDGSSIVFARWPMSDPSAIGDDMYAMSPDGSNVRRLTTSVPSSGATYYYLQPIAGAWQPIPVPAVMNEDGSVSIDVNASKDYPNSEYTIANKETMLLNGKLGDIIVSAGGTLKGSGLATTIAVKPGGKINPGNSPGCLSSSNLTLSGSFTVEIGSNDPCSGYDQLKVTGTVNIGGSIEPTLVNGFVPVAGKAFSVIDNDGNDDVSGTFSNLAEGATFTSEGVVYKISYVGGDGNDVTLTTVSVPASPSTGFTSSSSVALVGALVLGASILLITRRRIQQS